MEHMSLIMTTRKASSSRRRRHELSNWRGAPERSERSIVTGAANAHLLLGHPSRYVVQQRHTDGGAPKGHDMLAFGLSPMRVGPSDKGIIDMNTPKGMLVEDTTSRLGRGP
jgi:hypothetical protein